MVAPVGGSGTDCKSSACEADLGDCPLELQVRRDSDNILTCKTRECKDNTHSCTPSGFNIAFCPLLRNTTLPPTSSTPQPSSKGHKRTAIIIIVAVSTALLLLLGISCLVVRKIRIKRDLTGLELQPGSFSLRQIRAATNNFDQENKIGEGGFGPVYKGILLDGTAIAVKQLSSKSSQGTREFVNEIGLISAVQHPNLVKLLGCCIEGDQLFLVYDYKENNSLARALFGRDESQLHLDWPTRHAVCIGVARGLAHLHNESRLKIVHCDIKAANVLLDKYFVPKISDFGLAKLREEDNTRVNTRIAGTLGYMAPEYAMYGHLTEKVDVYSFGVLLLEVISGRSCIRKRPDESTFYLPDKAKSLKLEGNIMELIDPRLESNVNEVEVELMLNVALVCTKHEASERLTMLEVVKFLVGDSNLDSLDRDTTLIEDVEPPFTLSRISELELPLNSPGWKSDASNS